MSGNSDLLDGNDDVGNQEAVQVADINVYGDLHRYMLQGLIYAGILNSQGVKRLFDAACEKVNLRFKDDEARMPKVQIAFKKINEKIKRFDMIIKMTTCEVTAAKYYTFSITVETPILKFQKKFTPEETDMFQKCMGVILLKSITFSVPLKDLIKIADEVVPKKINSGADFVEKMLNLLYFVKYTLGSKKNTQEHVTLGARTMREFDCVLRESYQDVVIKCSMCLNSLLQGFKCPNILGCTYVIHLYCYNNYVKLSKQCPTCRTSWEPFTTMVRRVKEAEEDTDGVESEVEESASVATNRGTNLEASDREDRMSTSSS